MLYGPQSPTAFCNGPTCAEVQGDWVIECLTHMRDNGYATIEASADAARAWTQHLADLAAATLLPLAESWYMGANIPGSRASCCTTPGCRCTWRSATRAPRTDTRASSSRRAARTPPP